MSEEKRNSPKKSNIQDGVKEAGNICSKDESTSSISSNKNFRCVIKNVCGYKKKCVFLHKGQPKKKKLQHNHKLISFQVPRKFSDKKNQVYWMLNNKYCKCEYYFPIVNFYRF